MQWSTQAKPVLRPDAAGLQGSDAPRQIAPRRANASARKRADRMPDGTVGTVGTVGRVLNQSTPCVM